MTDALSLKCNLSNIYALTTSKSKLKLLIDIEADRKAPAVRPPLNLALAIDRSASMQESQKLDNVKSAAKFILEKLKEDDFISIIDFGSEVNVLVPAQKVTAPADIISRIETIRPKGATNLYGALSQSKTEINKNRNDRMVNRIILLSDGEATEGETSDEKLTELGRSLRVEKIAVTTLGVGEDYDEVILSAISQESGGNHYFIRNPEQISGIFLEEINSLLSLVARDVELKIIFSPWVTIEQLNQRYKISISGNTASIKLDDMDKGRKQPIIIALELTPQRPSKAKLADVKLTYKLAASGTGEEISEEVFINFVQDTNLIRQGINREVLKQWEILRGVQEVQELISLGKTQKLSGAELVSKLENIGRTMIRYSPVVAKDIMEIAEKTAKFNGVTSLVSKEVMSKTIKFQQGQAIMEAQKEGETKA